jgi:hypothetical protein
MITRKITLQNYGITIGKSVMDDFWGYLAKVDVIFGILGGLAMLWGFLTLLGKRIGNTGKQPKNTNVHVKEDVTTGEKVRNFLLDSISKADEPIGYTLLATLVLIIIGMISVEKISIISITSTTFSATFIGLVIGTLVDTLANTKGGPIRIGVWVAVILGGIVAFLETFSGSILLPSAVGGIIGSILGVLSDKNEQSKLLHPDGTWETAEEIAIDAFKKRNDKYGWIIQKTQIDTSRQERGKLYLTVSIVEKKSSGLLSGERWWPIERYNLTIIRTGEILEMKSVAIPDQDKYKGYVDNPLGIFPESNRHQLSGDIALIEVKKPTTSSSDKGTLVKVEFVVENYGEKRKIYPQVEFTVAQLRQGGFKHQIIRSPTSWVQILEPLSRTPIVFETYIEPTSQVVTDSTHPVSVRLHKSPPKSI